MKCFPILAAALCCASLLMAQSRTPVNRGYLQTDFDANHHAITNLAESSITNAATTRAYVDSAISGITLSAGRGIVLSGGQIHFASSSAYTTGRVPFANGSSGMQFATGLRWDPTAGLGQVLLGVGATDHIYDDGSSFWVAPMLISDDGTVTPHASSLVNIQSTTKGFLMPRMTTTQRDAISSPATGLLVVNTTTSSIDMWTGSSWLSLAAGSVGTVTSVGLSVPSWLSVSGTPVTSSGTLAVTAASGQTANLFLATPDGSTGSVSLRAIAAADVPASISRITGTETLQNKAITATAAGGNNTIKLRSYIVLAAPHTCDGAGAIIQTNDNTAKIYGQALFANAGATNANFIEYRLTVPEDIDTSAELKVERWKFRLGAADTAAQTYNIGMASVADSASYDSPTIGQWIPLSFAGDASGASGDVETVSGVTLTGWRSNMTAGQLWVIRVNRDGAGDASTQDSYSGPLVISYGSTQ